MQISRTKMYFEVRKGIEKDITPNSVVSNFSQMWQLKMS